MGIGARELKKTPIFREVSLPVGMRGKTSIAIPIRKGVLGQYMKEGAQHQRILFASAAPLCIPDNYCSAKAFLSAHANWSGHDVGRGPH